MSGFWSKFGEVLKIVGPGVLTAVGVPPVIGPLVIHSIEVMQAMPGADGATKKAGAAAMVNDGIAVLNAAKGETVLDPNIIAGAVSKGIDAVITTVGAVKAAHAEDVAEGSTPVVVQ